MYVEYVEKYVEKNKLNTLDRLTCFLTIHQIIIFDFHMDGSS